MATFHRQIAAVVVLCAMLASCVGCVDDGRATKAPVKADGPTAQEQELAANEATIQKLQLRIPKLEFTNNNFGDVVEYMRTFAGVNIHVSWEALRAAQTDEKTPVTVNLTDVTVEDALTLVLKDKSTNMPLGYAIDRGVVVISTKDDLSRFTVVRTYDVRDLVVAARASLAAIRPPARGNEQNNCIARSPNQEATHCIVDAITDSIARDSWPPNGTVGNVSSLGGGILVINQTPESHRAIVELLRQLRAELSKPAPVLPAQPAKR